MSTMSTAGDGPAVMSPRAHVIVPAGAPGGQRGDRRTRRHRIGEHGGGGVGRAVVGDFQRVCHGAAEQDALRRAVLVTARSAAWIMPTSTDASSSLPSGSVTSEVTAAVLVMYRAPRPRAMWRDLIGARGSGGDRTDGGLDVADGQRGLASDPPAENMSGAGSRSVRTTPVASDGPLLVTVTVNVIPPPADDDGARRPW